MSEIAQTPEPKADAKERLRLWLRLLKISRRIEADLRDRLRREFGTTLPRFDVMAALNQHEKGLKMSALSGVLKVSNGNVTGIVDRLVEDGMIIRVPVPGDRRASLVRLTRNGREEFARQAVAHEGWIDQLLRDFTGAEAEGISVRLDHIIQAIEQQEGGK